MSQRIIKLPRLTAATSAVWLSLHVCVPLQINLQIRKNPLYFLFSTTPASPRKAASIIGSCLHQLRSCEQLILPSQLPDPKCIMQKGPLLLGMVNKNMGFEARLLCYKISKQKPTSPVALQRPVQWAESCGHLPSAIWTTRGQIRVWDNHCLI